MKRSTCVFNIIGNILFELQPHKRVSDCMKKNLRQIEVDVKQNEKSNSNQNEISVFFFFIKKSLRNIRNTKHKMMKKK